MFRHSTPFPSCFRPSTDAPALDYHQPPVPLQPPTSGNTNLTTCLYQTDLGLFSLTWSRTFLGYFLNLHLLPNDFNDCSTLSFPDQLPVSTVSFQLHIKHFFFWKRHGSKKLTVVSQDPNERVPKIQVLWDLSRARFGSGPEPLSGFYIAVVVDRQMTLLVGDLSAEAFAKTKSHRPERSPSFVMKREHVLGNRVYTTKAKFGGRERSISIDCRVNNDARLSFSIDDKRVLQIKHLKWKFRGNERIEVDGVHIQVSWDVYNWLFEDVNNGHAVFMFRFETLDLEGDAELRQTEVKGEVSGGGQQHVDEKNSVVLWQQNSINSTSGGNGIEWRKMRTSLMRTARSSSSSSISMSSASSACSSSVMEWASSTEDSELCGPVGFSLLVYAWRK